MGAWTEQLVSDGMVVVEAALDPAFCEEVVRRRFATMGVDETDPRAWPTGWHNLPVTAVHPLGEVAPDAARVLHELVGGPAAVEFADLPDNLIVNYPDPATAWWPPERWDAPGAGWHKDGDWFRHFLDSPEQGLLAHPFLLHSASVNVLDRPRVLSNTSVMQRAPMRFDRPDGHHTPVERSILHHLGVDRLDYRPTGQRGRVVSERERRWKAQPASPG